VARLPHSHAPLPVSSRRLLVNSGTVPHSRRIADTTGVLAEIPHSPFNDEEKGEKVFSKWNSAMAAFNDGGSTGHRGPRVFIAEDSVLISLDLEAILEGIGCNIVGVSSSIGQSLHVIERDDIDVAVIDHLLDDGTSEPLTRALTAKAIPFVICTGSAPQAIACHPGAPVLYKPYNTEDVCRVVSELALRRRAGEGSFDDSAISGRHGLR
jgi:CheY-like chemotaxis protein